MATIRFCAERWTACSDFESIRGEIAGMVRTLSSANATDDQEASVSTLRDIGKVMYDTRMCYPYASRTRCEDCQNLDFIRSLSMIREAIAAKFIFLSFDVLSGFQDLSNASFCAISPHRRRNGGESSYCD